MSQKKSYTFILTAGCFWGLIGPFITFLNSLGSTSLYNSFLRMLFGCIFLTALCISQGGIKAMKIRRKTMIACIALGIICQSLYNLTYNMAIARIGVSYSSILLNSSPLFTAFMAMIILKEHIGLNKKIGIGVNVLGCILTVAGGMTQSEELIATGFIFAFATAICYATAPIIGKYTDPDDSVVAVAAWAVFFSVISLAVFNPFRGVADPFNKELLLAALAFGIITTGLGDACWYAGLATLEDSSKAPVLASSSMIVSNLIGIFLLGESCSLSKFTGLVLVFASILIINTRQKTRR